MKHCHKSLGLPAEAQKAREAQSLATRGRESEALQKHINFIMSSSKTKKK